MRRRAVSIPANIAEAFRRRGKADKARFLNITTPTTIPGGRGSHTPFNPAPPEAELACDFPPPLNESNHLPA